MTTSNVDSHDDATASESRGDRYSEARVDAAFDALSDARRRRVVHILRTNDRDVTAVSTLAEALADYEADERSADRLAISLRHVHLPKLAATGLVEYTADGSRVRYAGDPLAECLLDQL